MSQKIDLKKNLWCCLLTSRHPIPEHECRLVSPGNPLIVVRTLIFILIMLYSDPYVKVTFYNTRNVSSIGPHKTTTIKKVLQLTLCCPVQTAVSCCSHMHLERVSVFTYVFIVLVSRL